VRSGIVLTSHQRARRAERIARSAMRSARESGDAFRDLRAQFLFSIGPYATRAEAHKAIVDALARHCNL